MMRLALLTLAAFLIGCAGESFRAIEQDAYGLAAPALVAAHRDAATARREPRAGTVEPPDFDALANIVKDVAARPPVVLRPFSELTADSRSIASDDVRFAEAVADGLGRELLDAAVATRDPAVAAARARLAAAEARYPQALFLETILRPFASFLASLDVGAGRPLHRRPVDRDFPFPGALALKAEVIRQDVEIARAKHAEVVKDRTVAATRLWLNLWLTQREARIASRMRRWLGQLEATIRTRVESGKAASSQLLRVQVELGRIDDRVQALARRQSGLTEGLAAALSLSDGMTPGAPLLTDGVPSSPEGSEAIRAQARRFRPERALIRARAARTDAAIALMERTMTPLPTAGTSWFRGLRPVDEAGDGRAFGELPMTGKLLPFARVEVYIAEMRAMRRAIEGDLAADDRDTDRRLAVARAALVSSNETFAVHERKLIARARSAWDDTLAAYESDRVEFAELMTTVRSWLDLELARDRARHGAWMAALDIEGATGIRKYR